MIKNLFFAVLVCFLFATVVLAEGTKNGWELNLQQLSLNLTSTEVHNSAPEFSQTRLKADSQTSIQGKLDFFANYFASKLFWSNGLKAEYGKTYVRPIDKEETITENANKILLTTDLTYRLWKIENFLGGFEAGPFANIGYETEFDATEVEIGGVKKRHLRQIIRAKAGAKLFEGKYLKELYIAAVGESDFTYSPTSDKFACEAGFKAETDIRDGVKFIAWSYYRNYLSQSKEYTSDLEYEVEAELRLDVKLWNNLAVAPFVNYYSASAKRFNCVAENWYTGISLSYSTFFVKAKEI